MSDTMPSHVLLDRDGVLVHECNARPVTRIEDWRWITGSRDALRSLVAGGRRVGLATNQSVIGRGLATTDEVLKLHEAAFADWPGGVAALDFILFCPHAPGAGCACRKPAPGLLLDAARNWRVPPRDIVFVGDAITDFEASQAAGTRFALVRTGKGAASEDTLARAGKLGALWRGRAFVDLAEVAAELLAEGSGPGCDEYASFVATIDEHLAVVSAAREGLADALTRAAALCGARLAEGGKLLLCGNGGSAAQAQHFVAEMIGRFESERRPLAALALGQDGATLTAVGNDFGFEDVFARQLAALGRAGDVLIALSTSGTSPNVVRAIERARALGIGVIAFTGEGGRPLADAVDVLVAVPSRRVPRVQEVHELALHALAQALERRA